MKCECGCGGEASLGKRYIQHHQWRKKREYAMVGKADVTQAGQSDVGLRVLASDASSNLAVSLNPNSPPPHPLPYDHGRFRTAEEQPGTDLTQPWRLTHCLECREPTWSHDNTSKTKDEKLCESCAYLLVTELSKTRVSKENRTQRGTYDPFQS